MPTIEYDATLRMQFSKLEREWRGGLPRARGQIGGAITATVQLPPIGNAIREQVDFDLADFLRKNNFPFEEV